MPLNLKSVANGSVILNPASTVTDKTITLPATDGTMLVQDGTNTTTITNLAYTGTLTGGTGVINIGSGQVYKDASGNLGIGTSSPASLLHVNSAGASAIATVQSTTYSLFRSKNSSRSVDYGSDGTGGYIDIAAAPFRFFNGASELINLSSSGNLGLGVTPSAWNLGKAFELSAVGSALWSTGINDCRLLANAYYNSGFKYGNTATASMFEMGGGAFKFFTAPSGTAGNAISFTQAMTLDASGNLGVGTTSPGSTLELARASADVGLYITRSSTGAASYRQFIDGDGDIRLNMVSSKNMRFFTADTERARIDTSGNFMVGKTVANDTIDVGFVAYGVGNKVVTSTINAPSGVNTFHVFNLNATNYGYRFYVGTDGGVNNYSGNNVNLSDERRKKNIELSGSYLEKICAIPVKLFNYKDEAEGEQRTLGVIAQDVEAVAPEFVNNDGWQGTEPEDGVPLKTLYTTDMMFGIMKALQELKAEFDAYKAAHP